MHIDDVNDFLEHLESFYDRAAGHAGPHDRAEMDRFADRLSGLAGLDFEAVAAKVAKLPFPKGFLFARFFDARTGEYFGGVIDRSFKPIDTRSLLADLVPDADYQAAEGLPPRTWLATTAMPVTKPGVLDLAIDYRTLN